MDLTKIFFVAHSHADVPEDEFSFSLDPPQRPVPASGASEGLAPLPPAAKKKSVRAPVPPAVKKKSGIKKGSLL